VIAKDFAVAYVVTNGVPPVVVAGAVEALGFVDLTGNVDL
jgi:hypothetical protein